jgi:enoyl-[acyl-carrier protein] reductase I
LAAATLLHLSSKILKKDRVDPQGVVWHEVEAVLLLGIISTGSTSPFPLSTLHTAPMSVSSSSRRVALIMGVANHRSIAWACVQEFLARQTDCILTYHPRFAKHVDRLVQSTHEDNDPVSDSTSAPRGRILGHVSCLVESELPQLFQSQLPDLLQDRRLDSLVHSIAFADMEGTKSLGEASWKAYAQAQHVSAYSLLETARCALAEPHLLADEASLTALSYLGAVRALEPYHLMGPAKAALEALVRGLALEYGHIAAPEGGPAHSLRVNAVSAGPVQTLSSRGIPQFGAWSQQVAATAPLRRSVTPQEVAATVHFLATAGTGITGQSIYVDAGYSSVVPLLPAA